LHIFDDFDKVHRLIVYYLLTV